MSAIFLEFVEMKVMQTYGINFSLEGNWRQYEGAANIRDPGVPANVIVEDPTFLLIRKLSKVKHGVEVDITIW